MPTERLAVADGKKSNTAVKLHFVIPQVLLKVNRKFDRSRGRKERQEDEQNSCEFKLCYLPTVLHVICRREGGTHREEERLGETET